MYKIVDDGGKKFAKSFDSINDSYDQFDNSDDLKICSAYGSGDPVDLESLRSKIKNPKYVCSSCGRSTSEPSSLCSPETL